MPLYGTITPEVFSGRFATPCTAVSRRVAAGAATHRRNPGQRRCQVNAALPAKRPLGTRKRADLDVTRRFVTVSAFAPRPLLYNILALDSPDRCYDFWQMIVAKEPDHEPDKENLIVVALDNRLRPYAWHRVSIGAIDQTMAHPREIFRPIIAAGAAGFVMMHNHPCGDPLPSKADEDTTKRIVDCGRIVGINLLEHVIIGRGSGWRNYFSFRYGGFIPTSISREGGAE